MTAVEYGYCAHCNGRFIRTVNDEPNREWCGACPQGEPKGIAAVKKTYGYARKTQVPDGIGTPKVCGKCSKWFAAGSRQRTCQGCARNDKKTLKASSGPTTRNPLFSGGVYPGGKGSKQASERCFPTTST